MRSLGAGRTTSGEYGSHTRGSQRADYDAEAHKLFARLNLDGGSSSGSAYNDADVVYRHPTSGASFFIGNQSIASNKEALTKLKIFKIVNCQEEQAKNAHDRDPKFEYMKPNFSISLWNYQPLTKTPEGLLQYMMRLFSWVDERLDRGENVMVHCLAGAHRAGTSGVAYVMWKAGMDAQSALRAVKGRRPFVDPIYDFKDLLMMLDQALRDRRGRSSGRPAEARSEATVSRGPGRSAREERELRQILRDRMPERPGHGHGSLRDRRSAV